MMRLLFVAFGLMLVIEGIMPLAAPSVWREAMQRASRLANGQLRFIGLSSLLAGLVLLVFFH